MLKLCARYYKFVWNEVAKNIRDSAINNANLLVDASV